MFKTFGVGPTNLPVDVEAAVRARYVVWNPRHGESSQIEHWNLADDKAWVNMIIRAVNAFLWILQQKSEY